MFWRFGLCAPSAIDAILDRKDCTLNELLDEDELLQECKGHNKRLVDFLAKKEHLNQLLDHILRENVLNSDDPAAKAAAKYSFSSCEVFCCEVYDIFETLFANPEMLHRLFAIVHTDGPLPTQIPNYFHRCLVTLLQKRAVHTIAFIESVDGILPQFVRHVDNPHIKDALLSICFSDETSEGRSSEFLHKNDFVRLLVKRFAESDDEDVHDNVSQLLGELVQQSASFSTQDLYLQLQAEDVVEMLLAKIIEDTPTKTLQYGLHILIEILRHHGDVKLDPTPNEGNDNLPGMIRAIRGRLPLLVKLLTVSPIGITAPASRPPPFGFPRLKLLDFFLSLLRTRYMAIDKDLTDLKLLSICLDLFFKHPYNNFLHTGVEEIVNLVLIGESDVLTASLFGGCKLTHILVESFKKTMADKEPKGMRVCYVGHLVSMCSAIKRTMATSASLVDALKLAPGDLAAEWEAFCEGPLQNAVSQQEIALGGVPKPTIETIADDDDDEDDYDVFNLDDPNGANDIVQQAFSKYLTERVSLGHFAEEFEDGKTGGPRFGEFDDDDDDDEDSDDEDVPATNGKVDVLAQQMDSASLKE